MNEKTGKLNITELKETIVNNLKVLNPLKIILFGSYAYGNPNEDSDLDICIVEKSYKSKTKEKSKIRKLLKEINI
ncbi:nucleotidyltransferase domain-containing protein, partial [bacterium]|nr:nucleotidyltransferase domain-containing protein [bacterium]